MDPLQRPSRAVSSKLVPLCVHPFRSQCQTKTGPKATSTIRITRRWQSQPSMSDARTTSPYHKYHPQSSSNSNLSTSRSHNNNNSNNDSHNNDNDNNNNNSGGSGYYTRYSFSSVDALHQKGQRLSSQRLLRYRLLHTDIPALAELSVGAAASTSQGTLYSDLDHTMSYQDNSRNATQAKANDGRKDMASQVGMDEEMEGWNRAQRILHEKFLCRDRIAIGAGEGGGSSRALPRLNAMRRKRYTSAGVPSSSIRSTPSSSSLSPSSAALLDPAVTPAALFCRGTETTIMAAHGSDLFTSHQYHRRDHRHHTGSRSSSVPHPVARAALYEPYAQRLHQAVERGFLAPERLLYHPEAPCPAEVLRQVMEACHPASALVRAALQAIADGYRVQSLESAAALRAVARLLRDHCTHTLYQELEIRTLLIKALIVEGLVHEALGVLEDVPDAALLPPDTWAALADAAAHHKLPDSHALWKLFTPASRVAHRKDVRGRSRRRGAATLGDISRGTTRVHWADELHVPVSELTTSGQQEEEEEEEGTVRKGHGLPCNAGDVVPSVIHNSDGDEEMLVEGTRDAVQYSLLPPAGPAATTAAEEEEGKTTTSSSSTSTSSCGVLVPFRLSVGQWRYRLEHNHGGARSAQRAALQVYPTLESVLDTSALLTAETGAEEEEGGRETDRHGQATLAASDAEPSSASTSGTTESASSAGEGKESRTTSPEPPLSSIMGRLSTVAAMAVQMQAGRGVLYGLSATSTTQLLLRAGTGFSGVATPQLGRHILAVYCNSCVLMRGKIREATIMVRQQLEALEAFKREEVLRREKPMLTAKDDPSISSFAFSSLSSLQPFPHPIARQPPPSLSCYLMSARQAEERRRAREVPSSGAAAMRYLTPLEVPAAPHPSPFFVLVRLLREARDVVVVEDQQSSPKTAPEAPHSSLSVSPETSSSSSSSSSPSATSPSAVWSVMHWRQAWQCFQSLNCLNPWWLEPSYHALVTPGVVLAAEEVEEAARDVLDVLCRGVDPWMSLNLARRLAALHLMDGLDAALWLLHRLDPSHHPEEARAVTRKVFRWLLEDVGVHLQPNLHPHLLPAARVLIRLQLYDELRSLYNVVLDHNYVFSAAYREEFMRVMEDLVCPACSSLLVGQEHQQQQGATSAASTTATAAHQAVYMERRCLNCMTVVPPKDPGSLPSFVLTAEHVARIRARRRASADEVRQRLHERAKGMDALGGSGPGAGSSGTRAASSASRWQAPPQDPVAVLRRRLLRFDAEEGGGGGRKSGGGALDVLLPGVPVSFSNALFSSVSSNTNTDLGGDVNRRRRLDSAESSATSGSDIQGQGYPVTQRPVVLDLHTAMEEASRRLELHRAARAQALATRGGGGSSGPLASGDAVLLATPSAGLQIPMIPSVKGKSTAEEPVPVARTAGPWVCVWCREPHSEWASRVTCRACGAETGPQASWRQFSYAADVMTELRTHLRNAPDRLADAVVAAYLLMVYRRTFLLRAIPHDYQLIQGLVEVLVTHQERVLAAYVFTRFISPVDRLQSNRRVVYLLAQLFHSSFLPEEGAVPEKGGGKQLVDSTSPTTTTTTTTTTTNSNNTLDATTVDGIQPVKDAKHGSTNTTILALTSAADFRAALQSLSDDEVQENDHLFPLLFTPHACKLCFGRHDWVVCPILTRQFSHGQLHRDDNATARGTIATATDGAEEVTTTGTGPLRASEKDKLAAAVQQLRQRITVAEAVMTPLTTTGTTTTTTTTTTAAAAVAAAYSAFLMSSIRSYFAEHHTALTNTLSVLLSRLRQYRRAAFVLCHLPLNARRDETYRLLLHYYVVDRAEADRLLQQRPPVRHEALGTASPPPVSARAPPPPDNGHCRRRHPTFMQVTQTCCMCLEDRHASHACPRLQQWLEGVYALRERREDQQQHHQLRRQLLAQVSGWIGAGPERLQSFVRFLTAELTTHMGRVLRRSRGAPSSRSSTAQVETKRKQRSSPQHEDGVNHADSRNKNTKDFLDKDGRVEDTNEGRETLALFAGGDDALIGVEDVFAEAVNRTIEALLSRTDARPPSLSSVKPEAEEEEEEEERVASLVAEAKKLFAHVPPALLSTETITRMLTLGAGYRAETAEAMIRKEREESGGGSRAVLVRAAAAAVPLDQHCLFCFHRAVGGHCSSLHLASASASATGGGDGCVGASLSLSSPPPPPQHGHTFMHCPEWTRLTSLVQRLEALCEHVSTIAVDSPQGPVSAAALVHLLYNEGKLRTGWLRQAPRLVGLLLRLAAQCFAARELSAGLRLVRVLPLEMVEPDCVFPGFWRAAGLREAEVEERRLALVSLYDAERLTPSLFSPPAAWRRESHSPAFLPQWHHIVHDRLCRHCLAADHALGQCARFHEEVNFGRDFVAAYRMSMISEELEAEWQSDYLLRLFDFFVAHRLTIPFHITGVSNALNAMVAMWCFRGEPGIAARLLLLIPPAYRRRQTFRHVLHALQVPSADITRVLSSLQFSASSSSPASSPLSSDGRRQEDDGPDHHHHHHHRQAAPSSSSSSSSPSQGQQYSAPPHPLLTPRAALRDEALRVVFEPFPAVMDALAKSEERMDRIAAAASALTAVATERRSLSSPSSSHHTPTSTAGARRVSSTPQQIGGIARLREDFDPILTRLEKALGMKLGSRHALFTSAIDVLGATPSGGTPTTAEDRSSHDEDDEDENRKKGPTGSNSLVHAASAGAGTEAGAGSAGGFLSSHTPPEKREALHIFDDRQSDISLQRKRERRNSSHSPRQNHIIGDVKRATSNTAVEPLPAFSTSSSSAATTRGGRGGLNESIDMAGMKVNERNNKTSRTSSNSSADRQRHGPLPSSSSALRSTRGLSDSSEEHRGKKGGSDDAGVGRQRAADTREMYHGTAIREPVGSTSRRFSGGKGFRNRNVKK